MKKQPFKILFAQGVGEDKPGVLEIEAFIIKEVIENDVVKVALHREAFPKMSLQDESGTKPFYTNMWVVTEFNTGLRIAEGFKKDEALKNAFDKIKKAGLAKFYDARSGFNTINFSIFSL